MEHKHFSHMHRLCYNQVPQGADMSCSGCKSPVTGLVYACWQCNFYLHEQCFQASRSINHPCHPSHPLTLVPYPTYPSGTFICNTCNLEGKGFSFSCSTCDFDIHVICASMPKGGFVPPSYPPNPSPHANPNPNPSYPPNPNPHANPNTNYPPHPNPDYPPLNPNPNVASPFFHGQNGVAMNRELVWPGHPNHPTQNNGSHRPPPPQIQHSSHPKHPLALLFPNNYNSSRFICDACGENGNDTTYHCQYCNFSLHSTCTSLPRTVKQEDHRHPLALCYSSPYTEEGVSFMCDVCHEIVDKKLWVYYCKECDFGTHANCVNKRVQPQDPAALRRRLAEMHAIAKIEAESIKYYD